MRRGRKRGKERRNVVLLGLAVVTLAVMTVFVGQCRREPTRIMPPESPELIAKRLAPENAIYTVVEAIELLPMKPPPQDVVAKDGSGRRELYFASPLSLGELIGLDAPDDSDEFQGYLDACEPAVQKAREASQMEYYLELPPTELEETQDFWYSDRGVFQLRKVLCASAMRAARNDGDAAKAWELLFSAIRLGNLMSEDLWGPSPQPFELVAPTAMLTPTSELGAVRERLAELAAHDYSVAKNLENEWRRQDNALVGFTPDSVGEHLLLFIEERMAAHNGKLIRKHRQSYLDLCGMSYCEFKERPRSEVDDLEAKFQWYDPMNYLRNQYRQQAEIVSLRLGADLALALELHKREHGAYPATLAELVPTYLDAVPEDGFCQPFMYRPFGDVYRLYSLGPDEQDNSENHLHRKHDLVIYVPLEALDE